MQVVADAVEEPFAAAEQQRNDVNLHLVDQPRGKILLRGLLAPPASATSWPFAAFRACSSADSIRSVTNVNVVPPSSGRGSRA